jgi:hypothetical protein
MIGGYGALASESDPGDSRSPRAMRRPAATEKRRVSAAAQGAKLGGSAAVRRRLEQTEANSALGPSLAFTGCPCRFDASPDRGNPDVGLDVASLP